MSLFVSFTLTPMLCSRFLKLEPGEAGHAASKSGFIYRLVDGSYGMVLRGALRFKPLVVIMAFAVIVGTVPISKMMGMSLIPATTRASTRSPSRPPKGTSLERTSKICTELENRLRKLSGTEAPVHVDRSVERRPGGQGAGDVTRATVYVRMKELEERGIHPVRGPAGSPRDVGGLP